MTFMNEVCLHVYVQTLYKIYMVNYETVFKSNFSFTALPTALKSSVPLIIAVCFFKNSMRTKQLNDNQMTDKKILKSCDSLSSKL